MERRLTTNELIADSSSPHRCGDTPTERSVFAPVLAAPILRECRDADVEISTEGPSPKYVVLLNMDVCPLESNPGAKI